MGVGVVLDTSFLITLAEPARQHHAEHVITEDTDSLIRIATELKTAGKVAFSTIALKDGFDRAFFDPSGQSDFEDVLHPSDDASE